MAAVTIFELVQKKERELGPGVYPVFYVKEEHVAAVTRQLIDSIPTTKFGDRRFWIDIPDALNRGKLRISRTTLKLESNR